MVKIEIYKQLERLVVFDVKKVSEIAGVSRDYAKLLIHRMRKKNLVLCIEKGKYTTHSDELVVASRLIWPAYITGWAALSFHNLTEQIPTTITVVTPKSKKRRKIEFCNARIVFIKTKPKYFFGYEKLIYHGFEIFMADKEKTIVDSILFRLVSFSTLFETVKNNKKEFDFKKLTRYAAKTKNSGVIKRIGFLVEKLKRDETAKSLRKFVKGRYLPLDYTMPPKGKKNERWKVIENVRS